MTYEELQKAYNQLKIQYENRVSELQKLNLENL